MTLPFLDPAFDVIFVVAGDNKLGVVDKFLKWVTAVSSIRVEPGSAEERKRFLAVR